MDWEGKKYTRLTLDWDYTKRKVHLSMPMYIGASLKEFGHNTPSWQQDTPYLSAPIKYGVEV